LHTVLKSVLPALFDNRNFNIKFSFIMRFAFLF